MSLRVLWCPLMPLLSLSRSRSRQAVKKPWYNRRMRKKCALNVARRATLLYRRVAPGRRAKTDPLDRIGKNRKFPEFDSECYSTKSAENRRMRRFCYPSDHAVPTTYEKSKSAYADFGQVSHLLIFHFHTCRAGSS